METTRIQNGKTERIECFFINSSGAGITGGSATLKIRRKSDGYFWSGSAFQAAVATVAMTEVSAANDAGKYFYSFNTAGLADDNYFITGTLSSAANSPQFGELKVGDYVNYLDKAISSLALSIPMFNQAAHVPAGEQVWTKEEKDEVIKKISEILDLAKKDDSEDENSGLNESLKLLQDRISGFTGEIITNILQEFNRLTDIQQKGIISIESLIREGSQSGKTANAAIQEELAAKIDEQKKILESLKPQSLFSEILNKINLMALLAVKQAPTEILEAAQKEIAE